MRAFNFFDDTDAGVARVPIRKRMRQVAILVVAGSVFVGLLSLGAGVVVNAGFTFLRGW